MFIEKLTSEKLLILIQTILNRKWIKTEELKLLTKLIKYLNKGIKIKYSNNTYYIKLNINKYNLVILENSSIIKL